MTVGHESHPALLNRRSDVLAWMGVLLTFDLKLTLPRIDHTTVRVRRHRCKIYVSTYLNAGILRTTVDGLVSGRIDDGENIAHVVVGVY